MQLKLIIVLCAIIFRKSVANINFDWFDYVLEKINKELKVYQIRLFAGEKSFEDRSQLDLVSKKFTAQIPTITTSLNKSRKSESHMPLNAQGLKNSQNSDLYVFLLTKHKFNFEKIPVTLRIITESNPVAQRPKCMIVLLSVFKLDEADMIKLLLFAWSLYFLDFVILNLIKSSEPIIIDYSPFENIFYHGRVTTRPLFLDKLKNMNQYPVSTTKIDQGMPYVNTTGGIGLDYDFLKVLSESLNFEIHLIEFDFKSPAIEKVARNEFNVSVFTHLIGTTSYGPNVINSLALRTEQLILTAPIRSYTDVKDFSEVITSLGFLIGIVMSTIGISKIFQFYSTFWTSFRLYELLLGLSTMKNPQTLTDKIIFLLMAWICMHYSSDLIASISDQELVIDKEIAFDAIEEVLKPSLPIYMSIIFIPKEIVGEDEITRSLRTKTRKLDFGYTCIKEQNKSLDRFCSTSDITAKFEINKYQNPDGSPRIKVIEPPLQLNFAAFSYEPGSPYAEKFDQKLQQIIESGIQNSYNSLERYIGMITKKNLIPELVLTLILVN